MCFIGSCSSHRAERPVAVPGVPPGDRSPLQVKPRMTRGATAETAVKVPRAGFDPTPSRLDAGAEVVQVVQVSPSGTRAPACRHMETLAFRPSHPVVKESRWTSARSVPGPLRLRAAPVVAHSCRSSSRDRRLPTCLGGLAVSLDRYGRQTQGCAQPPLAIEFGSPPRQRLERRARRHGAGLRDHGPR